MGGVGDFEYAERVSKSWYEVPDNCYREAARAILVCAELEALVDQRWWVPFWVVILTFVLGVILSPAVRRVVRWWVNLEEESRGEQAPAAVGGAQRPDPNASPAQGSSAGTEARDERTDTAEAAREQPSGSVSACSTSLSGTPLRPRKGKRSDGGGPRDVANPSH